MQGATKNEKTIYHVVRDISVNVIIKILKTTS